MKIICVDHFTINVTSMENSMKFYGEVLGLKKGDYVDMGDHEIQYYQLDNNNTLELIKYKYNTTIQKLNCDDQGMYRHLAIRVDDVNQAYEEISKDQNVELLMKPSYCKNLNFTNFLIRDPNGIEIEVLER